MEQQLKILSSRPFQVASVVMLGGFLVLALYAEDIWGEFIRTALESEEQVALGQRSSEGSDPLVTTNVTAPTLRITDPMKGAANPKVIIVGFEDYTCQHCRNMIEVINKVLQEYPDTVRYVYKELPLTDDINDVSFQAANAARCADRQGAFWSYHDQLYNNQFSLDDSTYEGIAQQLGLNIASFQSCVEQQLYIPLVRDNYIEGNNLQLTGTPYYFINTQEIPGSGTYLDFKTVIDAELKKGTTGS